MKNLNWIIVFFIAISMIFSFVACTPTTQTPPKPVVELDERANTTIGNGNYVMHNYMSHTYGAPVDAENRVELVDVYLQRAEAYNMGLINDFEASLKGRPDAQAYFNEFINKQKRIDYEQGDNNGFDGVVCQINNYSKPIFEDIIRNLDTRLDRFKFMCYYRALSNEAYKNGFGDDWGVRSTNYDPKKDYEFDKSGAIMDFIDLHAYYNTDTPFDLQNDLENNHCRQITNGLDGLIAGVAPKMGNGITAEDLRKVVNYSFNINALDAMHDRYGDTLKTHDPKVCSPVEREKTILDVMDKTTLEIFLAEEANGMTM